MKNHIFHSFSIIGAQMAKISLLKAHGNFFCPPPPKQHVFQNGPFGVFNGHDIFSQGQQYHSGSIPDVFELSKWFSGLLRAQNRKKSTSKSPKYALKHQNKAYLGDFQVIFSSFCALRVSENHFDSSKTSEIDQEWHCWPWEKISWPLKTSKGRFKKKMCFGGIKNPKFSLCTYVLSSNFLKHFYH